MFPVLPSVVVCVLRPTSAALMSLVGDPLLGVILMVTGGPDVVLPLVDINNG